MHKNITYKRNRMRIKEVVGMVAKVEAKAKANLKLKPRPRLVLPPGSMVSRAKEERTATSS